MGRGRNLTQLTSPRADEAIGIFGSLRPPLGKAAIHVSSMPDILHENVSSLRIYLIHNAVISDPQAIQTLGTL